MVSKYRIPTGDLIITKEEKKVINKVLDSGRLSEGKYTRLFEKKWAKFIGTDYCTSTSSGSSALFVGLSAMNYLMQNKGEIATTPFTYIATTNSILLSNNTPSFVDIDYETMGMDPEKLKEHLESNPNTKAVLPVHIMGIPCKIDQIKKICDKHKVQLIEDNCQGYGGKYNGQMLGSFGLFSASSFFIAHTMQCSEMGSLNTSNRELYRLFDKFKSNGRTSYIDTEKEAFYKNIKEYNESLDFHSRYYHDVVSGNFRTTEFSSALACEQFKKIKEIIKKRNDNVKFMNEELEQYQDLIQLPKFSKDYAYLGYPLIIKNNKKITRFNFRKQLEEKRIETRPLYGCLPIHMPSLSEFKQQYEGKLPNAEYIGLNAFYVGISQYMKEDDLHYLAKSFKQIIKNI